jgi:cobalt-zinc-cadmium efflux system outer membrane protein
MHHRNRPGAVRKTTTQPSRWTLRVSTSVAGLAAVLWSLVSEGQELPNPMRPPDTPSVDAETQPRREVTLEELVAFAERHAPVLQIASGRKGLGTAAAEGASPLLAENPELEIGAGPRFGRAGNRDYDVTASLRQPIEIAGQRGRRLEVARRLSERLDAAFAVTQRELRRQITLAYRAATVARERVRLARDLVSFAEEMLEIARRRLTAGEATVIDLRIAEGDAARARQTEISSEQEVQAARLTLCELTGWALESPPLIPAGLNPAGKLPELRVALDRAVQQHPELRVKQATLAEARAEAELAGREAWPTPTLGVTFTREGRSNGPDEEVAHTVLGTIALPLPLWQRNQGERARVLVEADLALRDQVATAHVLRARIARSHAELAAATARLNLITSAITPSLEGSLELLRRGFAAGEIALLDVAVAREHFLDTRRDALGAYMDYYRALAEFDYLVGGGAAERRESLKEETR